MSEPTKQGKPTIQDFQDRLNKLDDDFNKLSEEEKINGKSEYDRNVLKVFSDFHMVNFPF